MSSSLRDAEGERLNTARLKTVSLFLASLSLSRWLVAIVAMSAMVALVVLPALVQTGPAAQGSQDAEEAQTALYYEFLRLYKTDQTAAYKIAREYLQKSQQETEQTRFVKRWVDGYEKKDRKARVIKLIQAKKFNDAFALGKEILNFEPEDVETLYNLTVIGVMAWDDGKKDFMLDAATCARKAIQLIESSKLNTAKDRDLGFLNSALGTFFLESNPVESVAYFYKAIQFDSYKRNASVHFNLAKAIYAAEYAPLVKEIDSRFTTQQLKESPEAKAMMLKLNPAIDRVVDVLARAVALAAREPKLALLKEDWMKWLTALYESRNSGFKTGLDHYIEEVLNKPLQR